MPHELCHKPNSLAAAQDYSIRPMDSRAVLESPALAHWLNIFQRCYNPKHPHYKWYGGRGIGINERWMNPLNFIVDVGEKPPGLSLDRIDNNGDYGPGNCRWATQEQQNDNTRRVKLVTYNGKTQSIKYWAKEYNINPARLSERLRRGWSMAKALSTPCPRGYEKGRAMHMEESQKHWKLKGRIYLRNSRDPQNRINAKDALTAAFVTNPIPVIESAPGFSLKIVRNRRKNVRLSESIKRDIIALAAQGKTCRAIASAVGVSKSSVSLFLSRLPLAAQEAA